MVNQIKNWIYKIYTDITTSIAFFPSLMSLSFMMIAFIMLNVEDAEMTSFLVENFSYLVINDADTARAIQSTIIGSVISLTVFSFSMVMVLLNQASSNFSPRLLPGLISDKKNQIVLGVYLGTIIYNIIVLISIIPSGDKYTLNGFSILLGIIFGILSLGLFVFFIHSISTGIQINNILESIFQTTKSRLLKNIEEDDKDIDSLVEDDSKWQYIYSQRVGYMERANVDMLLKTSESAGVNIKVLSNKGEYILNNMPIIGYDGKLSEEEQGDILGAIVLSNNHNLDNNYTIGIKQITEVGVKAMSPGINDPGTALMTIDYLSELLALRMQLPDSEIYISDNGQYKVELATINFGELMYEVLASYRQYCKHDVILMKKLSSMLLYLKSQSRKESRYMKVIIEELELLKMDYKSSIDNEIDRKKLDNLHNLRSHKS